MRGSVSPQLGDKDELAFRLEANQVWADLSHLLTSEDTDGGAGETPGRTWWEVCMSRGAVPVRAGRKAPCTARWGWP